MTETTTYRRATVADILTVCELGQILNDVHHRARPDIYTASTLDLARDQPYWLPVLEAENQATFLAEQGGVAVGFISAHVMQPTSPVFQPTTFCRIGTVGVAEAYRGQGIGRALMRLAETWAAEHGAADLRLAVWTFNESAIALYQELGFEVRAFEMGKAVVLAH
ncbi:MAG TPA: GNAT family N-acetyltransferase [Trinickia sp.]|jgi:ribosomal protein S18 acetylase RimI-like enzyme|nr:GNAT family N-acetyltransferase [Trinickia sp.]